MRRLLLAALTTMAATGAVAAPANAVVVGIASPTYGFVGDPLFQALHITNVRLTVPWNMMTSRAQRPYRNYFDAYLKTMRAAGVTPLVTFAADTQQAGNTIPSVHSYSHAIKSFIKAYPWVKTYSPWNEPDWVYRPGIARHPQLAAAYFNALAKACHHCKVLAGEVYLPAGQLARWLPAYIHALHYRPAGWALHNYYDVREHNAKQLKVMMRLTHGPIWLTEISGVLRRGHWQFKNQSARAAARDEKFLFSLAKHYHRIARIYHYQWGGTPASGPGSSGWDSGLTTPGGSARPAYYVIKKFLHR